MACRIDLTGHATSFSSAADTVFFSPAQIARQTTSDTDPPADADCIAARHAVPDWMRLITTRRPTPVARQSRRQFFTLLKRTNSSHASHHPTVVGYINPTSTKLDTRALTTKGNYTRLSFRFFVLHVYNMLDCYCDFQFVIVPIHVLLYICFMLRPRAFFSRGGSTCPAELALFCQRHTSPDTFCWAPMISKPLPSSRPQSLLRLQQMSRYYVKSTSDQ